MSILSVVFPFWFPTLGYGIARQLNTAEGAILLAEDQADAAKADIEKFEARIARLSPGQDGVNFWNAKIGLQAAQEDYENAQSSIKALTAKISRLKSKLSQPAAAPQA